MKNKFNKIISLSLVTLAICMLANLMKNLEVSNVNNLEIRYAKNTNSTENVILLVILFLLFTALVISLAIYFYTIKTARHKQLLNNSINEESRLPTLPTFVEIVTKLVSKHLYQKKYIISLSVDKFSELSLITLTDEEVKALRTELENFIISNIPADFYPSYAGNGVFYFYCDTLDPEHIMEQLERKIALLKQSLRDKVFATSFELFAGISVIEDKNVNEAIKCATIARIYNEKNSRVDCVEFNENMRAQNRESLLMKYEIQQGLKNNEFEVYYQPKFNIQTNRFIGAEALVRWNHPTRGFLSPGSFIPFAEQNGQISDIDRFVTEKVCQDIVSWKNNKTRLLVISVNLSQNEIFKPDLIDFYKNLLTKYKVSPLLLEIEITESAVSKDMLYAINIIKQLKNLRLRTAMDDFGTGYSSLSYLKRMPVDTLKLDKSFFDEIEIDKRSRDIVSTTISLAKALELSVVAEGIQTEKQIQFLKTTRCDCVQGFYYSKPLNKKEYESLLRKNEFE